MEINYSIPCYMIANTMNGGILGTGSYFDDYLEKVNPFLRIIIANIMSVITAIYLNGSRFLFSTNLDIYEKLTISINPTSYNFNDNEVKESYRDLYGVILSPSNSF